MRRVAALLVVTMATATGCTVGEEDGANTADIAIASSAFEPPSVGPDSSDGEDAVAISVYLVRDNRLVHVTREAPPNQLGPDAALAAAIEGPSAAEARAGLWSAIPPDTSVRRVEKEGEVATVDLSVEFTAIGGLDKVLAVAQVVYSVTATSDCTSVLFRIDGNPVSIPTADGSLHPGPLTPADFPDFTNP